MVRAHSRRSFLASGGACVGAALLGCRSKAPLPSTENPTPSNATPLRAAMRTLEINGKRAWQFEQFDAGSGYVGLQAEGRSFDFRSLKIRELP